MPMTDLESKELQRGWILEYLVTAGFRPVPPKSLLYYLRDMRSPTSWEGLNFHLEYMEQKGWVALTRTITQGAERLPPEKKFIAVSLTAAGVDEYDGRKAGDSGVRF